MTSVLRYQKMLCTKTNVVDTHLPLKCTGRRDPAPWISREMSFATGSLHKPTVYTISGRDCVNVIKIPCHLDRIRKSITICLRR